MGNAVLISNPSSDYDDSTERYHFPKQYLSRIEEIVGHGVIYYEARRNAGRMVYFATAIIKEITQDQKKPGHFYAELGSSYIDFVNPVPFRFGGDYLEKSLLNPDGTINPGKNQNAVRRITKEEYETFLQFGFSAVLEHPPITETIITEGFADQSQDEYERPIIQTISQRYFRDKAFAENVKNAYDKTCAMTGLRIINGGGRAEVQAAHIRPVAEKGTDSVRNGLALSSTVHWMFDRGLVSLTDDGRILKAREGIPETMNRMLLDSSYAILPERADLKPHPASLEYHREKFKAKILGKSG